VALKSIAWNFQCAAARIFLSPGIGAHAIAQTAPALADISRNNNDAVCSRPGIACASYWEWAKLILLSVAISITRTAVAGAMWWIIK
jgi:hypothetical protein